MFWRQCHPQAVIRHSQGDTSTEYFLAAFMLILQKILLRHDIGSTCGSLPFALRMPSTEPESLQNPQLGAYRSLVCTLKAMWKHIYSNGIVLPHLGTQ